MSALAIVTEQDQLLALLEANDVQVQVLPNCSWQLPGFRYYPEEERCDLGQGVIFAGCSPASIARWLVKFVGVAQRA